MPPELEGSAAVIAACAAIYAFVYEQGLRIEISERGLIGKRLYPIRTKTVIFWGEVETITTNISTIVTYLPGESIGVPERKEKLVVYGNAKKISLGTPPYRLITGRYAGELRWLNLSLSHIEIGIGFLEDFIWREEKVKGIIPLVPRAA